jgi:hypothetical protein
MLWALAGELSRRATPKQAPVLARAIRTACAILNLIGGPTALGAM